MADDHAHIRKTLQDQDEEFRHWAEEHHQHETRLAELARKNELSEAEELEEKQLKKRKLFLKDRMEAKIRGYELSRTA